MVLSANSPSSANPNFVYEELRFVLDKIPELKNRPDLSKKYKIISPNQRKYKISYLIENALIPKKKTLHFCEFCGKYFTGSENWMQIFDTHSYNKSTPKTPLKLNDTSIHLINNHPNEEITKSLLARDIVLRIFAKEA